MGRTLVIYLQFTASAGPNTNVNYGVSALLGQKYTGLDKPDLPCTALLNDDE